MAEVMYAYTVGGVEYTGRAVGYAGQVDTIHERGGELVDTYPAGRAVLVWYDPARPARVVLRPGIKPSDIVSLLVWSALALFCAVITWFVLRAA